MKSTIITLTLVMALLSAAFAGNAETQTLEQQKVKLISTLVKNFVTSVISEATAVEKETGRPCWIAFDSDRPDMLSKDLEFALSLKDPAPALVAFKVVLSNAESALYNILQHKAIYEWYQANGKQKPVAEKFTTAEVEASFSIFAIAFRTRHDPVRQARDKIEEAQSVADLSKIQLPGYFQVLK